MAGSDCQTISTRKQSATHSEMLWNTCRCTMH